MLYKTLPFLFTVLPLIVCSQNIKVTRETSRIDGKNATGYQVDVAATSAEARSSLARYLKAFGKTRTSGDYVTVDGPVINGQKYPGLLYATTRSSGTTTSAWIGMPTEDESAARALEKLAHDFGVTFRKEQIQEQIDESERALQAVLKQHNRLISQNKDLNQKIENNKRDKIELERSLVENKEQLELLMQRLEANKRAQDSIAMAASQIRKVVEMHRDRQQQVR